MAPDPIAPDANPAGSGGAVQRLALSKVEAAAALGVSVDFFDEHVAHELRIVRRGRRRLVPVGELKRWIDANAALALSRGRDELQH
jgi:hypothetical protein